MFRRFLQRQEAKLTFCYKFSIGTNFINFVFTDQVYFEGIEIGLLLNKTCPFTTRCAISHHNVQLAKIHTIKSHSTRIPRSCILKNFPMICKLSKSSLASSNCHILKSKSSRWHSLVASDKEINTNRLIFDRRVTMT